MPSLDPQIVFAPGEPPRSLLFDDIYHPLSGAQQQAHRVFLAGCGLPERWRGQARCVVLETGFGLGNNFLATWAAWEADAQRCEHLHVVSVEAYPLSREQLRLAHAGTLSTGAEAGPEHALEAEVSAARARVAALVEAWPPLTPGLHLISFAQGRVSLLLCIGDVQKLLPALELQADAIFLDGFAPDRNPPMWSARVLAAIGRKAAPGAMAASWCVARKVRDGLQTAGFKVQRLPSAGGKRQRLHAVFAPAFTPRRAPARVNGGADGADRAGGTDGKEGTHGAAPRQALIIGAGLAGAFAADALQRQGWACTVLDSNPAPAQAASGNPAGIFHGVAHAADGVHARFSRAAALWAAQRYRQWIASGRIPGAVKGLLQLRPQTDLPASDPAYLSALDAHAAAAASGLNLKSTATGGWLYPDAGWVSPRDLCDQLLRDSGIRFLGGCPVGRLRYLDAQARPGHSLGTWQALGLDGDVLAEAPLLVLAQGAAPSLLPAGQLPEQQRIRGQTTWFVADGSTGAPGLRVPVSGTGYAVRLDNGHVLCGASTQAEDADPEIRTADHAFNLQRLKQLTGIEAGADAALMGRVGWRATLADRMPAVGPVPLPLDRIPKGTRMDQCRFVPRQPGLWMLGGLASRGLTWGPLAAELLARQINGAPLPVESDLVDAVDPARGLVRAARRG